MSGVGRTGWAEKMGLAGKIALILALCALGAGAVSAQFQMPDPKQMSGIPRPVDDLPNGSLSVRLIRGSLANNIANHPVELHVGDKVLTVKTDEDGRAQFDKLPAGTTVKAVAVVDGEQLESQEFPAPGQGGIRLMLVATDEEKAAAQASAPAVTGQVIIAGESRLVIEPGDEALQLYYVLDIQNTSSTPVDPPQVFMFDMPTGVVGTSLLDGSSPNAHVNGTRVRVDGPFPPGQTLVQVGADLPVSSGTVELSQTFPAALDHLGVIVKKIGDLKLSSPQIVRQQDMPTQGEVYIAAAGNGVAAGQPVQLTLTGLPHHSSVPEWIALVLAGAIIVAGIFAPRGNDKAAGRTAERKRLTSRRERLLSDLVRLETERRQGRLDEERYETRREDLLQSLERVYGALDEELGPAPVDRPGAAA